jgi:hypothetical protein
MESDSERIRRGMALASGILMLAGAAHAVDGVIEINHACAASAGGCVAGDSGGYPVTIGNAGSYRLTSNLTVPGSTGGIEITVAGLVAIDMNGFAIAGPTTCTGCGSGVPSPLNCSGGGTEKGVYSSVAGVVDVRDGSIVGMGGGAIDVAGALGVTNVLVSMNGGSGIKSSAGAALTDVRSFLNVADGINVAPVSVVRNALTFCNGDEGIALGAISTVRDSTSHANGGFGLECGTDVGFAGNLIHGNSAGTTSGDCTSLGTNLLCVAGCP